VFRPTILIPRDALEWSEERIRIVLTHELAHITRFDWLAQILAEIARSIYWFNPLFWIASLWLRTESEQACDDAVLNAGFDPNDYASHLLEVARILGRSTPAWAAVLSMSRPPNLERRFLAMLNPALNHRSLTKAAMLGIAAVAVFVTLPLSAMQIVQPAPVEPALVARETPIPAPAKTIASPSPVVTPKKAARPSAVKPAASPASPTQAPALSTLTGSVYDGTGAVVPGVAVTLTRNDGLASETTTNDAGQYQFTQVPIGSYMLKAQLPGFTSSARRMDLQSNGVVRQNIVLSVGSISEEVTVRTTGQPRPPVQTSTPRRIRVGGNIQAAKLISQVKPVYPASARDAGIQGPVHLQGIIGTSGTLVGLRVVAAADRDLANAAIDAVRQWLYQPTLLNGEPVEVVTDITIEFEFQ
jgi:TonB family protein